MMFVRYFRSELMRSIKTKVCIVLFVAYICVGIYSAWFSGCWMSSGSLTGLGFFPDPRWVDVRGGDTTVIAPLAHSMFFPAFVLLAIALLFQEPVYGSPSEVSVARGRLELEIPVARVLATTLIMQLFYVCFSVLYALCMPIFEGSGIPFSLWHQFATRLGLGGAPWIVILYRRKLNRGGLRGGRNRFRCFTRCFVCGAAPYILYGPCRSNSH